jgi:predicted esterase
VPPGLQDGAKRDLIVLCHGTGLDYRWGFANHKPGRFRPDDVVVSPDGPSPGLEGTRLFLGRQEDVEAFAGFLGEMRRAFPVKRVFLYGHSQGGFFVVYFAAERPDMVDGVVAHASGAWNWTRIDHGLAEIPVAFMHGTLDPVAPYGQSTSARDYFQDQGHEMAQVRRMPGYNHWPNAARASECIDWCIGMRTSDPTEALARARAILTPKPRDEYEYECPVWFSGANDLLTRIVGRHARSFVPAAPGLDIARAQARPLLERVEAHAAAHIARLKEQVRTRDDLRLDGRAWLGHLISVREDMRGVRPVEEYARTIDYDAALARHREASVELAQTWFRRGGARGIFETVLRTLPRCFLVEGLPAGLAEQMPEWFKDSAALNLPPDAVRNYRFFLMWHNGRTEGLRQYRELWSGWSAPG